MRFPNHTVVMRIRPLQPTQRDTELHLTWIEKPLKHLAIGTEMRGSMMRKYVFSRRYAPSILRLAILGVAVFSVGCKTEPIQKPEAIHWIQTRRYVGWILQNGWGDCTCNPEDTPGTRGQWGIAPDGIPGWPTGLTEQDFKIEIQYHGNPNCCGDQSAVSRIWIGGNNADVIGVEFVGPSAPLVGYSRLMWKGVEMTRTEKKKGQWHTYTLIKLGSSVILQLDGNTIKSDMGRSFPSKLIVGGQCWTGCQVPNMAFACLFGNWNNFGYDVAFYVPQEF